MYGIEACADCRSGLLFLTGQVYGRNCFQKYVDEIFNWISFKYECSFWSPGFTVGVDALLDDALLEKEIKNIERKISTTKKNQLPYSENVRDLLCIITFKKTTTWCFASRNNMNS
jgi:hypothetical protein